MSKKTSFCEISVLKGQKIIWTIDLNQKNYQNKYHIASNQDEKVENLMELANKYIQKISKNMDEIKMDSYNSKIIKATKSIRKMIKNVLKMKNMRLSELSHQVNLNFTLRKSFETILHDKKNN